MQGQLLAEAKQLALGIMPKVALYQGNNKVGTIGRSLGFVSEFVYIHGLNWVIVGNVLTNRYRVFRNARLVFQMEPSPETSGYYQQITVTQEADEPLAILVAYVLNHWAHRKIKSPVSLKGWQPKWGTSPDLAGNYPCYSKKGM